MLKLWDGVEVIDLLAQICTIKYWVHYFRLFVVADPLLKPKTLVARTLLSHCISPSIGRCTHPKSQVQFFERKSSKIALFGFTDSRYIFSRL